MYNDLKGGMQKAKIPQQKLQEMKKMEAYGLTDAEQAQCIFWTAEGHRLTAISVHFEQNFETWHPYSLALVHFTRTPIPGVAIRR